jgi:hypothetical protein
MPRGTAVAVAGELCGFAARRVESRFKNEEIGAAVGLPADWADSEVWPWAVEQAKAAIARIDRRQNRPLLTLKGKREANPGLVLIE